MNTTEEAIEFINDELGIDGCVTVNNDCLKYVRLYDGMPDKAYLTRVNCIKLASAFLILGLSLEES